MVDGTKVVVPDSLDLITPYVLREQLDWFEDEVRFLRQLLQSGQNIIDIGANHGVYALSMATTVGSSGHVWAFEPAAATADLLRQSIVANSFDQITLEQCALSETEGTAKLTVNTHSELNALVHDEKSMQPTETVPLITLDGYAEKTGWQTIDFIKIDAEGEEVRILKGGEKFFDRYSPLVQYEIKAGNDFNHNLVEAFAAIGYDSYRLVPGLNLLVPFCTDTPIDRFQLNLFACKSDRADILSSSDRLIRELPESDSASDLFEEHELDWRTTLATMPYAKQLAARWERAATGEDLGAVEEALALYALSRDVSRPAQVRFAALDAGFCRFMSLVEASPTHPRLASLARIAADHGARAVAVKTLVQLCNSIVQDKSVDLDEPFLVPGERFDSVDPGSAIGDWVYIAAAEMLEQLLSFSSFYPGLVAKDRLEQICGSAFAGPEMHRRLSLLRQRFNLPDGN